jgi:hypothetical protein
MQAIRFFSFLFILVLPSCKNQSPTTINTESTILLNSSFESGGTPSSDGWTISSPPMGGYSTVVPPNGDTYSIFLEASNPGGSDFINIALPQGVHIFRFSVWAKVTKLTGRAEIDFVHAIDQAIYFKQIDIPDTTWREYSIYDTLSVSSGDSLKVFLSPGFSELIASRTNFDICKVEQIQ